MGILTRDERQRLINLLLKLPNIGSETPRELLLVDLPAGLKQAIPSMPAPANHIAKIVEMAESEAWAPLPDGSWPVLLVIENAVNMVPGGRLENDLQTVLNTLKARATAQVSSAQPVFPGTPRSALSGAQRRQLLEAILKAFPNKGSLTQMVDVALNINMAMVAGGDNLSEIVFSLIQWAEAQGRLADLVKGARQENPGNSDLQVIAQRLGLE